MYYPPRLCFCVALFCVSFGSLCWSAPLLRFDFEDEAQFAELRKPDVRVELVPETARVHRGKQSLRIRPDLLGQQWLGMPLPKDFIRGRISFWFYDPVFDQTPLGSMSRAGWQIEGRQTVGGKAESWGVGVDNYKEQPEWACSIRDVRALSGIKRRHGWTKFDLVIRGDGAERELIVYANGLEGLRFALPDFVATTVAFRTFWGADDIVVDDYVVDDDPESFRPAVVRKVTAGDAGGLVTLTAGEPLTVKLELDRKGAAAAKGAVSLRLFDLGEKTVGSIEVPVDWVAVKDSTLAVPVTISLQSRHYWVKAAYQDEGASAPSDEATGRINVQYLDAPTRDFRGIQKLAQKWDWMPAKEKGPGAAPPADWNGAAVMRNVWTQDADRRNSDVKAAWYRQRIEVPADWTGRRILLRIEQPHTAATVFVNGRSAGEVIWPGGDVDLTGKVTAGEKAELTLLVDGEADSELNKALRAVLGNARKLPEQFENEARGLGGEVALVAEPMEALIDAVTITTRVSDMTMSLMFSAEGLIAGKTYVVEGSVSRSGKPVKPFKSAPIVASSEAGTVKVDVPWPDAELWDLGKPSLYDLNARLVVDGKVVDAMWPERFGFREVRFEGRLVTVNGRPVNMYTPMPSHLRGVFGIAGCMQRNNLNYLTDNHSLVYTEGGKSFSLEADDHQFLASEAGFGADLGVSRIILRKFLVNEYAAKDQSLIDDPVYWTSFEKVVRHAVGRYGNQPGLFFLWGGGEGGQMEMGSMLNPAKQDGVWLKQFENRPVLKELLAVETKAKALLHEIDPRRRVIAQDAGNFQDAIHVTHYAGFMPMQEIIESDEYWLKYGTKPYLITEQTAPYYMDWTTGARLGHNAPSRIGTVAERAAATLGDAAFHRQPVDQEELSQFEKRFAAIRKENPRSMQTSWPPLGPLYGYKRNWNAPSVYRDMSYRLAREQWLNWRAEGLGLLCDWDATPGKEDAIKEASAPLTGYLAGNSESRTDKTHILRPGETWERQFLVLNNRRENAKVECRWSATFAGKERASGVSPIEVPAGGQGVVPIRINMPVGNIDGAGVLEATLFEDGKAVIADRKDFHVLPVARANSKAKIALIDPEGESAKALDRSGVPYQKLHFNADLSGFDVVVFGRKAFSYESKVLPKPFDLGTLVGAGKRVLVLEQEEAVLRNRFKFRTEDVSPRSMFGRIAGHPVTAGLPDGALNYWRGAATLTSGYEYAISQSSEPEMNGARRFITWNDGKEHPRQMKWGNTHNVATVVIQKPDRGNFRTIIDAEYALDYATVLELDEGSGKLLFCQADVSGRTAQDPAAERLLANMVDYLSTAHAPVWSAGIAYLGGPVQKAVLEGLRANVRTIESPTGLKPGEILVLGDGLDADRLAGWKDAIARFVQAGGVCLSMPRGTSEWNWLPFPLTVKDALVDATYVDKPSRPLLAGLSNGELYYPGRIPLVVLDSLPEGAFALDTGVIGEVPFGNGRYVFAQIAPDRFDVGTRFYLADMQKRTHRVIQALLNNLAVPMKPPVYLERQISSTPQKQTPLDLSTSTWLAIKAPADSAAAPPLTDDGWKPVKVPGYVNDQRPEWDDKASSVFWYRCKFDLKEPPTSAKPSRLHIGAIDDEDDVWLNGTQIGHTGRDTNVNDWLQAPRYYTVAPTLFRKGENEIVVRVFNYQGKTGISTGPIRLLWPDAQPAPAAGVGLKELAYLPPLNLSSPHWPTVQMEKGETQLPPDSDPRWRGTNLPDSRLVTETEVATVWIRRDFDLKAVPAGARPSLVIGAVDDEDETFLNGVKIGETTEKTHPKNHWEHPRTYPIPHGVLKTGNNRVVIKINNLRGAGLVQGPIEISWLPPDEATKLRLSDGPYLNEVGKLDDPYWWAGGW